MDARAKCPAAVPDCLLATDLCFPLVAEAHPGARAQRVAEVRPQAQPQRFARQKAQTSSGPLPPVELPVFRVVLPELRDESVSAQWPERQAWRRPTRLQEQELWE